MGQETTSLPRLTSFSTGRAPRGDEIDYWRQARREAYVSVRTDPVDTGFGGEIGLGQYTDFRLSTKRARAEEVKRSRSDIAQSHDKPGIPVLPVPAPREPARRAGRTRAARNSRLSGDLRQRDPLHAAHQGVVRAGRPRIPRRRGIRACRSEPQRLPAREDVRLRQGDGLGSGVLREPRADPGQRPPRRAPPRAPSARAGGIAHRPPNTSALPRQRTRCGTAQRGAGLPARAPGEYREIAALEGTPPQAASEPAVGCSCRGTSRRSRTRPPRPR